MGQVLHGSARTTEAVRRAIQRSEVSVRGLARRHGISPTTVQRWRKRMHATDATMGPKAIHSTVLTCEEEAMVVAFRRHTLLPLDDCLQVVVAPLPAAPWHQPAAGAGRRSRPEEALLAQPRSCATKRPGSNPCWWKPGGHVTIRQLYRLSAFGGRDPDRFRFAHHVVPAASPSLRLFSVVRFNQMGCRKCTEFRTLHVSGFSGQCDRSIR
jgi:hypothetical protein